MHVYGGVFASSKSANGIGLRSQKMIGIYVWTIYKHMIKYENVQVNVSGLKRGSSICKSTEYVYIHSYDTRVCRCTCCLLRCVCADTCLGEYVLIHAY